MTAPLSTAAPQIGPRRPRGRLGRALLRSSVVGALLAALVGGWLVWDNHRLVTTQVTVAAATLPEEFSGFRIVQVSDLHSRSFGEDNARLVEAVRQARPDAIAVTGDVVDRTSAGPEVALDLVEDLTRIAPVYYVTGNHEEKFPATPELLHGLEARGAVVLRGDAVVLQREGARLAIAGIDDPRVLAPGEQRPEGTEQQRTQRRLQALREDLDAAAGTGGAPFTVLLSHRPEMIDEYAAAGMDVVLAGHAHGGQVRLPLIGGLIAPDQGLLPRYTEGVHRREGTALVVSRGLGNSVAPIRVNDPPELVVLTLER
ncbi:metallophosphoesterase [Brachybacterium phenoliresistens]|uniref:Phosphoesterase n=1 Tax=Brachybacterium phenoliresistens TaxID=396014 RepID=Z9JXZ5_9MICO|nr:metallophosphoesterase [Brachybacterium phenoliresistens]EWS82883.1 phosphoesterase [Brachybacterium phenoliresistens]